MFHKKLNNFNRLVNNINSEQKFGVGGEVGVAIVI